MSQLHTVDYMRNCFSIISVALFEKRTDSVPREMYDYY